MPVRPLRALLLAACAAVEPAGSADARSASSLYERLSGDSLARLPGLERLGLSLGGWLSVGVTYNAAHPRDRSNFPVTFNDRDGEFQLNQLNLYLERPANKESRHWDIGGRIDFMWGTDSRYTQAAGHWDDDLLGPGQSRFYDIALPQAYVEIATPLARGATLKIGHFYTLLGYETVQAPNNFFYSHAYAMQYGEPFTHTGALASYLIARNLGLNLGAVTGPAGKSDNFDRDLGNWNFLGGLTWSGEDGATSLSLALTTGPAERKSGRNRTIASLAFNRDLNEKLHYVLQYDHGREERAVGGQEAEWYGINQYLTYALTGAVSLGLRAEWFRDDAGFRVADAPGSYYEATAGLAWKPEGWLLLRLEARNDWLDARRAAFAANGRQYQFTLGANAVASF